VSSTKRIQTGRIKRNSTAHTADRTEYFCSGTRRSLAPTLGGVSTATFPDRFWEMIQRAWRSLLLNRALLVLAVLASAATVVILGFLVNLFIQGYSGGNDPTSIAPLAFPIAILGFVIAGIPALVISTLLWLAYTASKAGRARARGTPDDPSYPPL
jgi:hypothetical protein